MSCREERNESLFLYLENALQGQELEEFEKHLAGCGECKDALEAEMALGNLFNETRPLFAAPDALKQRVARLTDAVLAPPVRVEKPEAVRGHGWLNWMGHLSLPRFAWKPAVAICLVVFLVLFFIPDAVQRVRATEYVEAATEIHTSYLSGNLPLQCHSHSPDVVTSWFAGKTPFPFRLPAPQAGPRGAALYWLTGARVVTYRGMPAALVAYETATEKITLLAVAAKSTAVSGGEKVQAGSLTFHYRRGEKFQVITWSNNGLSYALVSSLTASAKNPCLVCHQDMSDHMVFEELTHKNWAASEALGD